MAGDTSVSLVFLKKIHHRTDRLKEKRIKLFLGEAGILFVKARKMECKK